MSAHLDKLMMQVALIDQVTKPLKGIQNTVTQTADVGRSGWEKMAGGTAGVVAAGFAVQQALMPAIEMDRVLGEVKSLGVIDKDLQQLQQTALNFSVEYGKSAQEVVGAAYDIKSAFGEISGPELSDITKSSAVLAAATKADTATITDYMGTMYGVFKNQANDMGVGIWSKNVAGMTAQSVEMFKTTGKGMSDAFTSVGANATSAGIKMNEQMAILGSLQSTMSGSEAGTKYKAFLAGVGGAQDKLNMKFVDSQGAMLPMMDILDKLKSQFGNTLDVAESDALKKAFGSEEAVSMIKLLMADTNGLAASINTLGNIKGMSKAEEMAGAMTDQWERLEASWFAIRAGAFGLILPSINAIAGSLADGIHVVLGWTQEFPVLTQYIGYFALAVVGSAAVIAAWNLVMGASSLVMTALKAPLLFTKAAVLGLSQSYKAAKWSVWAFNYSMLKQGVYTKNASVLNKVYATSALFMNRALMMASNGIKAFSLVMLKSAAAMLMNPIFWIPAAIVAVGVAVAALITHWDDIMAALNEIYIFRKVGEALMWVAGVFGQVFSAIGTQWDLFVNAIASSALFQNVIAELSWLFARFSGVFSGIATVASGVWSMVGAGIRFVLSPLNVLYTAFKGFFVFLKDGPEAAMAVWQGIPELFTGIWQSLTAGLSSITSGFMLFASSSMGVLMALAQPFVWLGQQVHALIHGFIQGWTSVMAFISDMSPFQLIGDGIDWLIEKINLIPGIDIGAEAPELSSVATRDMGAMNTIMYQPQATARMSQQSLNYGAEHSGLQALPSYQSSVYYQNQLSGQPELPELNGTATYHSQLMGMDTPEMSVNSANAERVSVPISQYLNGGSERKANMSEQLKMLTTAGNTDNSRTQHMGDVYITQEQPFTRDQLSEWNEMDTP